MHRHWLYLSLILMALLLRVGKCQQPECSLSKPFQQTFPAAQIDTINIASVVVADVSATIVEGQDSVTIDSSFSTSSDVTLNAAIFAFGIQGTTAVVQLELQGIDQLQQLGVDTNECRLFTVALTVPPSVKYYAQSGIFQCINGGQYPNCVPPGSNTVQETCDYTGAVDYPYWQVGKGFNLLTLEPTVFVLDMQSYSDCLRQPYLMPDGTTVTYKIPDVVDQLYPETIIQASFQTEQFSSGQQLQQTRAQNYNQKISAKAEGTIELFSASLSATATRSGESQFTAMSQSTTSTTFFSVRSAVTVAKVSLKRNNLRVSPDLLPQLQKEAPWNDTLTQVVDNYGPAIVAGTVLGGRYQFDYAYSTQSLSMSATTSEQQNRCLKVEAEAKYLGVASGQAELDTCKGFASSMGMFSSFTEASSNRASFTAGGSPQAAQGLSFGISNPGAYSAWVTSVGVQPLVVEYTDLLFLHQLLDLMPQDQLDTIPDLGAKKQFLIQAEINYLNDNKAPICDRTPECLGTMTCTPAGPVCSGV